MRSIVIEHVARHSTADMKQIQYSIFIKSPLCGSSDLIYKFGKRKRLIYKS